VEDLIADLEQAFIKQKIEKQVFEPGISA